MMVKVILKDDMPNLDEGRNIEFVKGKKITLSEFINNKITLDECVSKLTEED